MTTNKEIETKKCAEKNEDDSLKGALFSSVVFVGGTIVVFMAILLAYYIARI
ncbi:hypothetical protein SAMN05880501_102198 [Ureibacillus xyleni]|uniref:Uncharacterized protein n=1 Tax=Ureibacillus xyleni TaxID=614648 RepID=A0A285RXS5_9BACL|nr:hypothetical protein [Ureibacillus xyleni]SOB99400.1 hypothetical protein SAMN05880501_102198 [Ureibacillus xyleni]